MTRPVVNMTTNEVYPTVRLAAEHFGISPSCMTMRLRQGIREFFGEICLYEHILNNIKLEMEDSERD